MNNLVGLQCYRKSPPSSSADGLGRLDELEDPARICQQHFAVSALGDTGDCRLTDPLRRGVCDYLALDDFYELVYDSKPQTSLAIGKRGHEISDRMVRYHQLKP